MSPAHIAVAILGTLSLLESLWGLTNPRGLQKISRGIVDESPSRSPGVGIFFLGLACGLWLMVSAEQRLADYILIVYSWLLVGGGLLNLNEGGMKRAIEWLILRRQPGTIRLLYAVECAWAIAILLVALRGL